MIYICTYININCINEYIWSLRKIVEGVTCCSYGASSTGTGSICFELNLSCYWFSFFPLVLSFSPFFGFACSSFHEIIHALGKLHSLYLIISPKLSSDNWLPVCLQLFVFTQYDYPCIAFYITSVLVCENFILILVVFCFLSCWFMFVKVFA